MPSAEVLASVFVALFIGGAAKGIVGFGIQVVALAWLTIGIDLLTAMGVLLAPAIATNLWQAFAGGSGRRLLRRLWPFLLAVTIGVFVGALALTRVALPYLGAVLGLVLVVYASLGLGGLRLRLPSAAEPWLGPAFGAANGLLTGMTGATVVPGTLYLQSLDLGRDRLVQAMGMLYLLSAAVLALAMRLNGLLGLELGLLSCAAVLPAMLGLYAGQRIRRALSEAVFRKVFYVALLALGLHLLARLVYT